MSPIEIAAVSSGYARTAPPAAQTVGREFEALLLKLLWETARSPVRPRGAGAGALSDAFSELFLNELAKGHGLGFGNMVLQALHEAHSERGADVRHR
jgi:Rod binding domain-containing protein